MIDPGNLLAEPSGESGPLLRAALDAPPATALTMVALSGPDAVGKTTQIRLLTRRRADTWDAGPLDAFDPRWRAAHDNDGGLAAWWFTDAPLSEVADVLACSYLERARHARTRRGLVLIDRGPAMLEASVTATAAVRLGLGHARAAEHARALLAPYADDLTAAFDGVSELLLLHAADPQDGAAQALARRNSTSPLYRAYQHTLHQHLHADPHPSDETIVTGTAPIMQVHRQLCHRLRTRGIDVPLPVIDRVRVIALGGLSESGKSTAGAYLAERHGSARLKIGYLLELAAARHRIADVYAVTPVEAAELLVDELDRFCAAHHYQRLASIESLHSDQLAAALKPLLGDGVLLCYLDTVLQARQERGVDGPGDVADRDTVKHARGADRIHQIADVVVPNNGPLYALQHRLDRLIRQHAQAWPQTAPHRTSLAGLSLPEPLNAFLHRLTAGLTHPRPLVDLVAVTGSAARGGYTDGWSDLDVLLLADEAAVTATAEVVARHEGLLGGVKLGITLISTAECRAGVLPSRLLHAVAAIAAGTTAVLWHVPGLRLPCPDPHTVAVAGATDAAQAAVQIRRLLLRRPLQVRALYKTAALLAKIVLGAQGSHHAADHEALAAFAALTGEPISCRGPGSSAEDVTALAQRVLGWWLAGLEAR
ncbi:nucleotidyltransferase domain-containing protein [Nonomuraea sp. PA05]|uniref:nucleotidyltransferase domain-containing protein n=1 Tax=Nonomuraea sp. PA05 TaxID=2604466 RepID=UPI0011DB590E|nr:nucleotidyltransferase domain-containing protein [Nonomuraea sp. PA05]TYB63286.1 nucleotidyltransferase domain-containing protein [Nonomuraea sp. PA05]